VTTEHIMRTAVIGAGHLGQFHARVHSELPECDLRYVADVDLDRAREVAAQYGGEPVADFNQIIGEVDAVSVVTPTSTHHVIARPFLEAGVSVLLEKPMARTVLQADELIDAAASSGAKLQIGHIERFNPAFRAVRDVLNEPAFIECHRLSPYPFRGTDVSVVLDLMIHDLDLILALAGSGPTDVRAAGLAVLSKGTDIANARLEFGSAGCVANITTSRVSPRPMRRLRVFQSDAYISMDLLEKKVFVFRPKQGLDLSAMPPEEIDALTKLPGEARLGTLFDVQTIELGQADALKEEIAAFIHAVTADLDPPVSGAHGRRALALAVTIDSKIGYFLAQRR
jgi:predicted dehydrogenase